MSTANYARIPSYRRHKPTGQAVVTLNGKDLYLGRWGTPESRSEYDRLIAEWIANGRQLRAESDLTVNELIAAYMTFAEGYYQKNGKPTGALPGIRVALGFLRGSYGHTLVHQFGPLALSSLQKRMAQAGQSRIYVNDNVDRIRRCFKWGVSRELVPVAVHQALTTVAGLRKGRSEARETEPIGPVSDETVNLTLRHLSPVVADMIRLQRLTGCRPGEVCLLRPCDLERAADVWAYRPATHKTEHHGRGRVIFIGPRAQAILLPYLLREAEAYCFSPAESEKARRVKMRAKRKSPVQPSQLDRSKPSPQRIARDRYTTASYRRAIHRACSVAFPPTAELTEVEYTRWRRAHQWHPNQLRHAAATDIRAKFDLEAVQTVLGHSSANVSEIYAERDQRKAVEVMRQVG